MQKEPKYFEDAQRTLALAVLREATLPTGALFYEHLTLCVLVHPIYRCCPTSFRLHALKPRCSVTISTSYRGIEPYCAQSIRPTMKSRYWYCLSQMGLRAETVEIPIVGSGGEEFSLTFTERYKVVTEWLRSTVREPSPTCHPAEPIWPSSTPLHFTSNLTSTSPAISTSTLDILRRPTVPRLGSPRGEPVVGCPKQFSPGILPLSPFLAGRPVTWETADWLLCFYDTKIDSRDSRVKSRQRGK